MNYERLHTFTGRSQPVVKFSFVAVIAASTLLSGVASAQSVTTVATPEAYTAPVYGNGDVVVAIPQVNDSAIQTVDAVEYVEPVGAPSAMATLDMSGADGTLRACYENDGIAKQREDFTYFCNYEKEVAQPATASAHSLPADAHSSYQGTTNIVDEALIDCVNRGGTLIQLAANEQFACAM